MTEEKNKEKENTEEEEIKEGKNGKEIEKILGRNKANGAE